MRRHLAIHVLVCSLVVALAIHFGFTVAYLTPLNPIKIRFLPLLEGYMQPFFEQRWELFAPNPITETRILFVSCRIPNDESESEESPWVNISAPLRELKHKYRLTPADRMDRAQMTALHLVFEKPDPLTERLQANPEDTLAYKKAIEHIEKRRKTREALGMRLLARTASVECDRLYGVGRAKEVRLRLVTYKSPPFSRRKEPLEAGTKSYKDFGWMTYERVALP